MARPRKDSGVLDARTRIIEAFWSLIEHERITELSVGHLADAAGCNRGTFYYHFKGIDDVCRAAVDQILTDDGSLVDALWRLATTGELASLDDCRVRARLHRLITGIEAGAAHEIGWTLRDRALERWRQAACPQGGELGPDACFAIQFMVSGVLDYVVALGYADERCLAAEQAEAARRHRTPVVGELSEPARMYLREISLSTVRTVAQVQGIDESVLLDRISCLIDAPAE